MAHVFALAFFIAALPAHALSLDAADVGLSKMIPARGDTITWAIPVVNDAEEDFGGEVTMTMRFARGGERLSAPVAVSRALTLAPEAREELTFEWTAPRNGYYRFLFEVPALDLGLRRDLAVTERDTYFVWFGTPKEFRWCNVPTTVKRDDEAWWVRRGAIPAAWKCGVCCKDMTVEQFVANWGAADWIAIDEVGGPGEVTDKFIAAWEQLKRDRPHQWTAVWYMGAHRYWADIKHLVDLFLPEIYLNYRGNHLGQFDAYFRVAREAGVMDQVIPALGINEIKDKQGRVTNSPTKADVLRQFRYIKRTAPELKGIGFFTSYSAAWGVAEYADALCEDYYIKPVLTMPDVEEPIRVVTADGGARTVSVTVKNVGGMDAEDITLEWRVPGPDGATAVETVRVAQWPVDEAREFTRDVTALHGPVRFSILPAAHYTVLDGDARRYVAPTAWSQDGATPVIIPPGTEPPLALPQSAPVDRDGPFRLEGEKIGPAPAAVLPPRPGMEERLVVFPRPAPDPHDFRAACLVMALPMDAPAPAHSRDGSLLTISNEFYRATLDLATDQIVSLGPQGGMENVLREPWRFGAAGHEGFGAARVEELPGCLVVTIPHDSAQAFGESQYVFLAYSPAIRVARSWNPKGEVTLSGAGDRCGLLQRGGSFASQRGVGALVSRGRLHDGDRYRDLLFGYGGERPRPDNADKAGWIDFSYGREDSDGGMGVVIDYRWVDSDTKSYDVTRLYDASDWLEVLYLWGVEKTFDRPQRSCVHLIPHRRMDFTDEAVVPPAQALWEMLKAQHLAAYAP